MYGLIYNEWVFSQMKTSKSVSNTERKKLKD